MSKKPCEEPRGEDGWDSVGDVGDLEADAKVELVNQRGVLGDEGQGVVPARGLELGRGAEAGEVPAIDVR